MDDLGRMFDRLDDDSPNSYIFTFAHPTKTRKITYRQQQELLRIALEEEKEFKDGFIMDTVEKGVQHPVIHVKRVPGDQAICASTTFLKIRNNQIVSISANDELNEKYQDQLFNSRVRLLAEDALGPDIRIQQGIFKELKRIEPDYLHTRRDRVEHRAFVIVGMPSVDARMSSTIETWWRDWTGARSIYLKLRHDHDLGRIIFYRRTSDSKDSSFFAYLVLAECWNVTPSNELAMFDFVQRIRVEHINSYISLYRDLDVTPTSISGRSLVQRVINERMLTRATLPLTFSSTVGLTAATSSIKEVSESKKNGNGFQANVEWNKLLEVKLKDHEASR